MRVRTYRVTSYSRALGAVTTTITAYSKAHARRCIGGTIVSIVEVQP